MTLKITLKNLLSETRKLVTHSPQKLKYYKEDVCRMMCQSYSKLDTIDRYRYINELSNMHEYNKEKIHNLLSRDTTSDALRVRRLYSIKESLQPRYRDFFINLGRVPDGIKLLVDLRSDIMEINQKLSRNSTSIIGNTEYSEPIQDQKMQSEVSTGKRTPSTTSNNNESEMNEILSNFSNSESASNLYVINAELKDLITVWFSGGICKLERITWDSSCRLLEKISILEAVHPVKGWVDIKRRVGSYRRCYVFTHLCMPNEPVVILHTALCSQIPSSIKDIVTRRFSKSNDNDKELEDPEKVLSAIFYSISSPYKALNGIDLGNTLIKRVVQELRFEFPNLNVFATLSPVPGFRKWLDEEIQNGLFLELNTRILGNEVQKNKHLSRILTPKEISILNAYFHTTTIKDLLTSLNMHLESISEKFVSSLDVMERANDYEVMSWFLKNTAVKYLCSEKYRGYALDPVCNFHLKNGAVLWGINWLADSSPRGLQGSYGVMVNYRYYIENTEKNSDGYLDNKVMEMSDEVKELLSGNTLPKLT